MTDITLDEQRRLAAVDFASRLVENSRGAAITAEELVKNAAQIESYLKGASDD